MNATAEHDVCPACGQTAHSFMRLERVVAAAFNGFAAMMCAVLFVPKESA